MTNEAMHRDLGRMDAEIKALQSDLSEVMADIKAIRDTLAQAKGGWRTLMLVAGIAGAIGAAATKLGMWTGLFIR